MKLTSMFLTIFLSSLTLHKGSCDLTQDVEIAITQLAVFEEAKSQFNQVILNITTYDIDVEMRRIVDDIANRLQLLHVPESEVHDFLNTSAQHKEYAFRSGSDLSYLNDIFGSVGQEISGILHSGDFETLQLTYNTFLMYQLRLGTFYTYFLSTLNFNEEALIVNESLEGQEGSIVDEINVLIKDAATLLDVSVKNYELQYNAYRQLISDTDTTIETVINQIFGNKLTSS